MKAEQCRGARAMLEMSREELARRASVPERSVADFEAGRRQPAASTLQAMRRALESAGVIFTDGDEPGVKLRRAGPQGGLSVDKLTSQNDT
jgi:transcriptional regulator with XRE-family HTH domain